MAGSVQNAGHLGSNSAALSVHKVCWRWMHEYILQIAWKMFKEHNLVEISTRNVIWGLHQGAIDDDLINGQVHLLTLLNTIAASNLQDGWERWLDQEGKLPLEIVCELIQEVKDEYAGLKDGTKEVVKQTEIQAVLQCCSHDQFRLAREVLTRIWKRGRGNMDTETYRDLQTIIETRNSKHTMLRENTYADYIEVMKSYLSIAFDQFETPTMVRLARPFVNPPIDLEMEPSPPCRISGVLSPQHKKGLVRKRHINHDKFNVSVDIMEEIRRKASRRDEREAASAFDKHFMPVMAEKIHTMRRRALQNKNNNNAKQMKLSPVPDKEAPSFSGNSSSSNDSSSNEENSESEGTEEAMTSKPASKKLGESRRKETSKGLKRVPWTDSDSNKLRKGVALYGQGKWALIKDKMNFANRTPIQLKDRWRIIGNKKN